MKRSSSVQGALGAEMLLLLMKRRQLRWLGHQDASWASVLNMCSQREIPRLPQHTLICPETPWCSPGGTGGGSWGEDGPPLPPEIAARATRMNAEKQRAEWERSVAREAQISTESLKLMSQSRLGWGFGLCGLWCGAVQGGQRHTGEQQMLSLVMIPHWCNNSTHIFEHLHCNNAAGKACSGQQNTVVAFHKRAIEVF